MLFLVSLFTALFLCCLLFPSVRASITAADELLDVHEAGLAMSIVASRAYLICDFYSPMLINAHLFQEHPFEKQGRRRAWQSSSC